MSSIAIIPARGGSKRIPGKNIKNFCGKPIIAYSIEAAIASKLFDRVVVSTDSEEIAEVARKYGAEVPFARSAELSTDCADCVDVVLDTIKQLRRAGDYYEYACCLYATAPFIEPDYLKKGLRQLEESDALMAFAVTSFEFPILRGFKINSQGCIEMFWPEYENARSQELPESYHDAGQFYWFRTDKFTEAGRAAFPGAIPVILPRYLVQDVDSLDDWEYAEIKYEIIQQRNSNG